MNGAPETDHKVLLTLARFFLATAEQLHQLHGGTSGIKQTQKRMERLRTEGLTEFITLPQAGRAKAWYLTETGSAVTATFPAARRPEPLVAPEQAALRYGRGHLLDLGRVHTAFVADARARGESFGLLDFTPAPTHPVDLAAPAGPAYRPAAELAYTATTNTGRRRLRAFLELHHPDSGTEQTAEQLAACARLWQQPGPGGTGWARERRWRPFPALLVVLTGTPAGAVGTAVEDLLLAAEENPATADLLAAVPAGAARLEDLVQHGPAAAIWHPLSDEGQPPVGWTALRP